MCTCTILFQLLPPPFSSSLFLFVSLFPCNPRAKTVQPPFFLPPLPIASRIRENIDSTIVNAQGVLSHHFYHERNNALKLASLFNETFLSEEWIQATAGYLWLLKGKTRKDRSWNREQKRARPSAESVKELSRENAMILSSPHSLSSDCLIRSRPRQVKRQ